MALFLISSGDHPNEEWEEEVWELRDDLSELLQHEYDHLNGILATQRAIDNKSFRWRSRE
jgi:peptide deformylase